MKLTEYEAISSLAASNVLVTDGSSGTKNITAENAAASFASLSDKAGFFKNLGGRQLPLIDLDAKYGSNLATELKADISAGTFEKAIVGGYFTRNSHKYYLAHPDYWLHCGDTECTTHHMLVVPAVALNNGQMHITESGAYESGNVANTTEGAYVGSDMKSNASGGLATAAATIQTDMAAAGFDILTHREYFSNAVSKADDNSACYESAGSWYDSTIDLMNEAMVYGGFVFNNCQAPTTVVPNSYTIDKSQLLLFQMRPDLITTRANWWLRDVVSSADFAIVDIHGIAGDYNASHSNGVRPAFAIY